MSEIASNTETELVRYLNSLAPPSEFLTGHPGPDLRNYAASLKAALSAQSARVERLTEALQLIASSPDEALSMLKIIAQSALSALPEGEP